MRAVTFVSRLEFQFKGNVPRNALCLADVDNDQDDELAVGNLEGNLVVFKGKHRLPWLEAHGLGMVMVVIAGDILNKGKNYLVSISGEGFCKIFDATKNLAEGASHTLKPFHSQTLPANTKVALLADVDGDGSIELVLGLTDHVLRTYRWVSIGQGPNDLTGKLVGLHKLEIAEQIGNISLNPCIDGSPYVLVAQPGGTYINFQCPLQKEREVADSSVLSKLTPKHHPLASCRMRNRNISSEILGGIRGTLHGKKTDALIAVVTLDGTLMLVDGDDILWSLQVDHQLFAITKMDLTGDGNDDVVVCAWDGQTYMVNQSKQSVRFQFDEPVSTFTSGTYSVNPGHRSPSMVYVTYNDCVYLYYDVQLPCFGIRNFQEVMDERGRDLMLPFQGITRIQLSDLYSYLLYEYPAEERYRKDNGGESS